MLLPPGAVEDEPPEDTIDGSGAAGVFFVVEVAMVVGYMNIYLIRCIYERRQAAQGRRSKQGPLEINVDGKGIAGGGDNIEI